MQTIVRETQHITLSFTGICLVFALICGGGMPATAQQIPDSVPAQAEDQKIAGQDSSYTARPDSATAFPDTLGSDEAESAAGEDQKLQREELLKPSLNPTAAVLMTPVYPGWGELYARSGWRATLAFGIQFYYVSQLIMNNRLAVRTQDFADQLPEGSASRDKYDTIAQEYHERALDFIWWALGGLLIISLDAYVGAHLFEFNVDPVPVPTRWDMDGNAVSLGAATSYTPELLLFRWRVPF